MTFNSKKTPVVNSINPTVGSPGDIMIISGENFGSSQGFSFVEIGGNKITSSCYLSWTDSQIKLVLPSNIQDGLVIVDIRTGRSKPLFFANETDIPVAIRPDPSTLIPGIESLSESTVSPGQLIVITGSNYGNTRGNSQVYFTANYESKDANQVEYIAASDTDYDYEFWSDSEIKVRVPDGAKTGSCYVATDKGNSNHISLTVQSSAGNKKYDYKRTYLVRSTADIANAVAKDEKSAITLRIPRPSLISSQPSVELSECSPEPVIENYKDTIVHQIQLQPGEKQAKTRFSQNFVISVYAINTT
ncbi:MAG: IPT/TIG domain-containing protein, partial [Treponema sp.]|nr:IPT/TIG domain-containing protein [Treponema sp.]